MATRRSEERRNVLSASTLVGDPVRNREGEDLGEIEEIMLDVESGRVAYAVLSFGGFLGMGEELFALPWPALTLDQENQEFLLDVDRERLEDAEGFDEDDWPDFSDPTWGAELHAHYGFEPYWRETSVAGRR